MEVTLEDYRKAEEIVKDYRVCSGYGCGKLFKETDTTRTIYYGQVKHWCAPCYEKVKDDD